MKKFTFRLETLLRLRRQAEDECREALAAAVEATRQAHEVVKKLEAEREALEQDWAEAERKSGTDVETFRDFEAYRAVLQRRLNAAHAKLTETREHERNCRLRLQEAAKKRRILEKLRERHEQRHAEAVMKEQQNQLDEHGTTRFVRRKETEAEE
jgi:flagellar FliJ protein